MVKLFRRKRTQAVSSRNRNFGRASAIIAVGWLIGAWLMTLCVTEPLTSLVLGGILGSSVEAGVAAEAGWLSHR
jgi:hypothetical protein